MTPFRLKKRVPAAYSGNFPLHFELLYAIILGQNAHSGAIALPGARFFRVRRMKKAGMEEQPKEDLSK